jgi:hypothetical protein
MCPGHPPGFSASRGTRFKEVCCGHPRKDKKRFMQRYAPSSDGDGAAGQGLFLPHRTTLSVSDERERALLGGRRSRFSSARQDTALV